MLRQIGSAIDRDPEPDRRGHRHLPADARAAGRSGGLFRGPGRDHAGDRADPQVKLGLDKPLPEQFVRYISDLGHGDLGKSLTTGQPVATEIATACRPRPN